MQRDEMQGLRDKVDETRVDVAEIKGDVRVIAANIAANVEQRQRMEVTLGNIASEFKAMNGRTRKNEDAIAVLQSSVFVGPDGNVTVTAQRPPLTTLQKTGVGALAAAALPNLIELVKQIIQLLQHGAVR